MSNVHGHLAATATRTPHVGTLHGEGSVYSRRFIRFLSLGRRTGLSLVSVSAAAATSIQRLISGRPIPHIYNGIDTEASIAELLRQLKTSIRSLAAWAAFTGIRARTF